jgi:DNA-binding transcriptional MerR regulator
MFENTLLKIGEFSRLSQVTVKTLHHYDDIGLLKPSQIDRFTSYRYYTLDQLPRIHNIMALKELGLSLEEITHLLKEDLPPDQIRGMYRLKLAEAQQRVREEQARMAQIEFRLRQIELEGILQTLDIVIKRIEPFFALTMRRTDLTREIRLVVGKTIEREDKAGNIQWNGASPMEILYEDEFHGDYSEAEFIVPVDASHTPTVSLGEVGTLTLREIPAIESAATFMHEGDYDTLPEKYLSLQRWAVENGYKLSGVWRFVYHRGPLHHVDPSEYLTELQHPLEPTE